MPGTCRRGKRCRGGNVMKVEIKQHPSHEDIVRLVMAVCSRENLVRLARQKGLETPDKMDKRKLCQAILH